jgi:hypothetical protein
MKERKINRWTHIYTVKERQGHVIQGTKRQIRFILINILRNWVIFDMKRTLDILFDWKSKQQES